MVDRDARKDWQDEQNQEAQSVKDEMDAELDRIEEAYADGGAPQDDGNGAIYDWGTELLDRIEDGELDEASGLDIARKINIELNAQESDIPENLSELFYADETVRKADAAAQGDDLPPIGDGLRDADPAVRDAVLYDLTDGEYGTEATDGGHPGYRDEQPHATASAAADGTSDAGYADDEGRRSDGGRSLDSTADDVLDPDTPAGEEVHDDTWDAFVEAYSTPDNLVSYLQAYGNPDELDNADVEAALVDFYTEEEGVSENVAEDLANLDSAAYNVADVMDAMDRAYQ